MVTPDTTPPPGGAFLVEEACPEAVLTPERLDAEVRLMAETATAFLRGEVLPVADRLQEQEPGLMPHLLRRAAALGLLATDIPERYGGLGLAKSASARIAEALAAEPSFAVSHSVHTSVATLPLVLFGTEEQKQKHLPRLASGEWLGAYALSEAHAGSDALAVRTRAVPSPDGKGFRLTGEKMWITNAAFADLFTVFAKVNGRRFTAFLVERGSPGLSIGREERKLGLKGTSTCRLVLDAVPVPAENLLARIGQGTQVALYTLNLGRFKIAASAVGQGKNLLGIATRYAKQRQAFGKPIAEYGLIREKLAVMAARLFASESMLYRVAGYLDAASSPEHLSWAAAEEYAIECALIKVACTETLDYVADECLQIHGGYGYSEEFPAARAWRDARVNRIYEGTNEINRLNMVELFLKRLERGRLTVGDTKYVPYVGPPEPQAQRSLIQFVLTVAKERFPDLMEQQEIAACLADLFIELFANESILLRAEALAAAGSAERADLAWQARERLFNHPLGQTYDKVLTILTVCGAVTTNDSRRFVRSLGRPWLKPLSHGLAAAVLAADGYPW